MLLRIWASAVLLALVPALFAQKPDDVVRWTAKGPAAAVRRGATVNVELTAQVEGGWQLYALVQPEGGPQRMRVAIAKAQPFAIDATRIDAPLPAVKENDRGDAVSYHYEDHVTLAVPVTISSTVKSGSHRLPIEVTYQVCSGSLCLRPFTQTIPVQLTIRR